jgi:hypothetical protein
MVVVPPYVNVNPQPIPTIQNRTGLAPFVSLRAYTDTQIDVNSFSRIDEGSKTPVAAEPIVGSRWGKPAQMSPSYDQDSSDTSEDDTSVTATVENQDVYINRHGEAHWKAYDQGNGGAILAENTENTWPGGDFYYRGPRPHEISAHPYYAFQRWSLFYCGSFIEHTEEVETLPHGVTITTPIETEVRIFVEFIPYYGEDDYHCATFSWDQGTGIFP